MGTPTLEQPVPGGLHPVEGTHAGASCEMLHPMGRTHAGAVHEELQPMGRTHVGEVFLRTVSCARILHTGVGAECEESSP